MKIVAIEDITQIALILFGCMVASRSPILVVISWPSDIRPSSGD
jgi:hypothetical protein